MKIAILTVPFNNNYGGYLQAYALKLILQHMGHDVLFLMRKRNRPSDKQRLVNFVKWLLRRTTTCYYLDDYHTYKISKNTRSFVEKYLFPLTRYCYTSNDFQKLINSIDADVFIAGSDQCWRYKFAPGYVDDYFFKSLTNTHKKRISYAASFGVDYLEYDDSMLKSCAICLKEFSYISVREASGIQLLENYFGVEKGKAKEVLDPTFLLSRDKYDQLTKGFQISDNDYIFTYILDKSEEKELVVKYIQSKSCYNRVNQDAFTPSSLVINQIEPVELWLSRICNASYVVTDSFHGMVFSIIFNKPFIVFGNAERGSTRFYTLLKKFDLLDRCIDSYDMSKISRILNQDIDWAYVNQKVGELRLLSLDYLCSAINGKKH